MHVSFLSLTFAEEYYERGSDTNNVGILFCYILSARMKYLDGQRYYP